MEVKEVKKGNDDSIVSDVLEFSVKDPAFLSQDVADDVLEFTKGLN